jgi:hypothetical protein
MTTDQAIWENHATEFCQHLDERQRRWFAGLLSEVLGWGGTKQVSEVTGIDPKTIRQGRLDIQAGLDNFPKNRVRNEGAGRPELLKKSQRLKQS